MPIFFHYFFYSDFLLHFPCSWNNRNSDARVRTGSLENYNEVIKCLLMDFLSSSFFFRCNNGKHYIIRWFDRDDGKILLTQQAQSHSSSKPLLLCGTACFDSFVSVCMNCYYNYILLTAFLLCHVAMLQFGVVLCLKWKFVEYLGFVEVCSVMVTKMKREKSTIQND